MAKLPTVRRISATEFPEQSPWIEKLLTPINSFFDAVYTALNKDLTFGENLNAEVRVINYTTTDGLPSFTPRRSGTPLSVTALSVIDQADNPAALAVAIWIDWTYDAGDNLVRITNITGPVPAGTYKLVLLIVWE